MCACSHVFRCGHDYVLWHRCHCKCIWVRTTIFYTTSWLFCFESITTVVLKRYIAYLERGSEPVILDWKAKDIRYPVSDIVFLFVVKTDLYFGELHWIISERFGKSPTSLGRNLTNPISFALKEMPAGWVNYHFRKSTYWPCRCSLWTSVPNGLPVWCYASHVRWECRILIRYNRGIWLVPTHFMEW